MPTGYDYLDEIRRRSQQVAPQLPGGIMPTSQPFPSLDFPSGAGQLSQYSEMGQDPGILDKIMGLGRKGADFLTGNPMGQYLGSMALARLLGFKRNPMALTPMVQSIQQQGLQREQLGQQRELEEERIRQAEDRNRLLRDQYSFEKKRAARSDARTTLTQIIGGMVESDNYDFDPARIEAELVRTHGDSSSISPLEMRREWAAAKRLNEKELRETAKEEFGIMGAKWDRLNNILVNYPDTPWGRLPSGLRDIEGFTPEMYEQTRQFVLANRGTLEQIKNAKERAEKLEELKLQTGKYLLLGPNYKAVDVTGESPTLYGASTVGRSDASRSMGTLNLRTLMQSGFPARDPHRWDYFVQNSDQDGNIQVPLSQEMISSMLSPGWKGVSGGHFENAQTASRLADYYEAQGYPGDVAGLRQFAQDQYEIATGTGQHGPEAQVASKAVDMVLRTLAERTVIGGGDPGAAIQAYLDSPESQKLKYSVMDWYGKDWQKLHRDKENVLSLLELAKDPLVTPARLEQHIEKLSEEGALAPTLEGELRRSLGLRESPMGVYPPGDPMSQALPPPATTPPMSAMPPQPTDLRSKARQLGASAGVRLGTPTIGPSLVNTFGPSATWIANLFLPEYKEFR